ncbi:hypothetical protein OXPF_23400 [Oxobacter pfennigii]|uniref:Uncharacterized protein n=1 Tax=Oxobacter pfennigii TaxID=36849 RepID=A0A0P8W818_9CLOT|nr:hypothetical protein [Oxobacter pfennigii]KPU44172.1 hypothetical protein OXPF_23400 [Oxobacter pfennigii]
MGDIINFDEERLLRSYDRIGNEIVNYIKDMDLTWEIEMAQRIYFGKYFDSVNRSKVNLNYKPFIQWLIFSYKLHNGNSLLECINNNMALNNFEKDTLMNLRNTYEGLYQVHGTEENGLLVKDVFSEEKICIRDNRLNRYVKRYSGIFTRIVTMNNKSILLPGYSIMSNNLLKETEKYIKERYRMYNKFHKNVPIQKFIDSNSLVIHRYFLNFHI